MQPGEPVPTVIMESSYSSSADHLNQTLSASIGCLFSAELPLPFSNVSFYSAAQKPVKRSAQSTGGSSSQNEVDGFHTPPVKVNEFAPPSVVPTPSTVFVEKQTNSAVWDGHAWFEQSIARLGLSVDDIHRLVDSEEGILKKFGRDMNPAKRTIKSELKDYDTAFKNFFGKEPARPDKEPMRLLYNLYRKLRDMILVGDERSPGEQRLEELYDVKLSIRQVLQDYQAQFMNEQGRRIKYHRDIIAVEREYRQYKQLKEEINRLEVQLGRPPQSRNTSANDFFN